jgi:hypothetical protein
VLLLDDRVIAKTRATDDEKNAGIAVKISLHNRVRDPQRLHRLNEERSWIIGRAAVNGPPTCQEQPSNIADLVAFKRINSNVRSTLDCEGGRRNAFAKKSGERQYEFVVDCQVNCQIYNDYDGWCVEYFYNLRHLEKWETVHNRLKKMLDEWTLHIDRDN